MQVKACPADGGWSDGYPVKQGHGENKWLEQILLYFFCRHNITGVFCIGISVTEY